MLAQFKRPLIFAGVVFSANAALLLAGGFVKELPEGGGFVQTGVSVVRVLVQFALPAICGLIIGGRRRSPAGSPSWPGRRAGAW
jgi:hypothetical protein